jgi:predicted acylesterase/phospholipase RssA
VFCATELQAGEHFYFSPRFLYSYRFGCGQPGDLALSTAVQASACLPGAFAARRLDTAGHRFQRSAEVTEPPAIPEQMLLTDGGVYDNMADQWAGGLAARVRDNAALDIKTTGLDELIVANASAGPPWTRTLPTVLRKLGPDATARLLWHSYVLAACNLHVLLPGFTLPPHMPSEDGFRDLVG